MAGLDLFSIQQDIEDYVRDRLSTDPWDYEVYTGAVPEAETLVMRDGVLQPYVVLRFSELMPVGRGSTWAGTEEHEFYSYVDAMCVARTDTDARQLSGMMNRIMLGKIFPNTGEIRKIYGGGTFAVPDAKRIPVAFLSLASFAFNTNLTNPGSESLRT